MDFSTIPPTITLDDPDPWLGPGDFTTSICNKHGDLQFYSGGCFVGNRLHEIMESGDSINSDVAYTGWCHVGDFPMVTSNTIIPFPGDSSKYILFNLNITFPDVNPDKLLYHVIDMEENNGLGKVVEKNKTGIQDTALTLGFVSATKNSNGVDWWVVVPQADTNCYQILPVTANGVGPPKTQCIGQDFVGDYGWGQSTFSPGGTRYARMDATNGLILMDFDPAIGLFSNPITLEFEDTWEFLNGVSFSGNSQYLYATASDVVYQFDTHASEIQESKIIVGQFDFDTIGDGKKGFALCQLAPNGKIYIAGTGLHNYISVINKPNCNGTLCDLQDHSIVLPANNFYGINNLPHFYSPEQTYDCLPVGTEENNPIATDLRVFPNPCSEKFYFTTPQKGQMDIYSMEGKLLYTKEVFPGVNEILPNLTPGLYILNCQLVSGRNETLKLLVL